MDMFRLAAAADPVTSGCATNITEALHANFEGRIELVERDLDWRIRHPDPYADPIEDVGVILKEQLANAVLVDYSELGSGIPAGVRIGAVMRRANPRFALIHREGIRLEELPADARVSCESPVARWQFALLRPDVEFVKLDGGLAPRLHKVHLEQADAAIERADDLSLLGFAGSSFEYLSTEEFLPAPAQGVRVLLCRLEDTVTSIIEPLHDVATAECAQAELALASACPNATDLAAWTRIERSRAVIETAIPNGDTVTKFRVTCPREELAEAVHDLGQKLASALQEGSS